MSPPTTIEADVTSPVPTGFLVGISVFAVVLGAAVLAWTDVTVAVVATLFGFHLVMLAGTQLAVASRGAYPTSVRVLVGVMGAYLLVVGLVCLFDPLTSLRLLAVLVAIGWIADAVGSLASARHTSGRVRTGLIAVAALSLAGALMLLLWPGLSLVLLVRLGGWLLVAFGIAELVRIGFVRRTA